MLQRAWFCVGLSLGVAALAQAQVGSGQPRVIQYVPVDIEGTLAGLRPGGLAVTSATQEIWMLQVAANATIHVTGGAEADVLRPGLNVRFVATVDKRQGKVHEPVSRLVLFAPAQDSARAPGVFPPGEDAPRAGTPAKSDKPPGPGPPSPIHKVMKPSEPRSEESANANEETLDIRGQIVNVKGHWITVGVPPNPYFKSPLRIELAAEPAIEVDLVNYSIAKPGDMITARGRQLGPKACEIYELTVALSEPLGSAKKKPAKLAAKPLPGRTKAGEHHPPAEIAQTSDHGKRGSDGPSKPESEKPAPPAPSAQKPASDGSPPTDKTAPLSAAERVQKISELLQLKPEQLQGKASLSVRFGDSGDQVFSPARLQKAAEITKGFGQPEQIQTTSGSLPLGEGGAAKQVQWQLWTYGPLRFFVDEAGEVRYYQLKKAEK